MASLPIKQFITEHLSQDCISRVGHIQKNGLEEQMQAYLTHRDQYDKESILTVSVKLMDYHGCLRDFAKCADIQLDIEKQLESTEFQDKRIEAEYAICCAYQNRNHKPTEDFNQSEAHYERAERLISEAIKENPSSQENDVCRGVQYSAMISRFWLYANYMENMDKAEHLRTEIAARQIQTPETINAFTLAFLFFSANFFLKNNNYEQASLSILRAELLNPTEETQWFFDRIHNYLDKTIEAIEKFVPTQGQLSAEVTGSNPLSFSSGHTFSSRIVSVPETHKESTSCPPSPRR